MHITAIAAEAICSIRNVAVANEYPTRRTANTPARLSILIFCGLRISYFHSSLYPSQSEDGGTAV